MGVAAGVPVAAVMDALTPLSAVGDPVVASTGAGTVGGAAAVSGVVYEGVDTAIVGAAI
jgi:hypothetical protein